MKTGHDGDCSYYAAYDQRGDPIEAGICTCGYGWQQLELDGNIAELYSKQRLQFELSKANREGLPLRLRRWVGQLDWTRSMPSLTTLQRDLLVAADEIEKLSAGRAMEAVK